MFRTAAIAAECFVTLAWMRVALRVMPSRVLRGVIAPSGGDQDFAEIAKIFNRVAAISVLRHTCMHRALALQRVLARRGIAANLQIGLGRRPKLFPGHAWLEVDGAIVNDDPELVARYVPLTISETALRQIYR
jgi:transglutaminase superfamily protein